jgi:opacity protein-like surface antigen
MKRFFLLLSFSISVTAVFSQSFHLGVFGGLSNYQGDLTDGLYVKNSTKAVGGLTLQYELTERLSLRGGFMYGKITGNDDFNTKTYLQARNLDFTSSIAELSLVGEFTVFNLDNIRWSPYVFGGLAVFRFNPYTHDADHNKVFLKPLSTEGQGLEGYDNKPYSLTQVALPFGGGIKYALTDNIRIGAEVGIRKTFTDYLDDVSTNYADPGDLMEQRGQLAVDYSYRGDEVPGGSPAYPLKGAQRGGAEQKDLYYFSGLTLSFRLGGGYGSTFASKNGRSRLDCPKVF